MVVFPSSKAHGQRDQPIQHAGKQHDEQYRAPKEDYDLLEAIMVYPAKEYDYDDDEHGFLELLNLLFIAKGYRQKRKEEIKE